MASGCSPVPCYSPLKAWRSAKGVTFSPSQGISPLELPCGQCIGCRLERSRQWAVRCMHEAQLYLDNSFVTLTYSEDHLPNWSTLVKRHFQLFMKRLRKTHPGVRFFHCGEYGDTTNRPHYHALLFNCFFSDRELYKVTAQGHSLYTSKELDRLWGLGACWIGAVTFESAAYVARYCVKKITGDAASAAYEVIDPITGEIGRKEPEYATMSRRPGIGAGWYEKFRSEVYPSDFVVRDGVRMLPPQAYDRWHGEFCRDPTCKWNMDGVRRRRVRRARLHKEDQTPERLRVREEVKEAQARLLKRGLE